VLIVLSKLVVNGSFPPVPDYSRSYEKQCQGRCPKGDEGQTGVVSDVAFGQYERVHFQVSAFVVISPSSELLARKRSRRIHLSRSKSSSTRRSSPDSGAQTKRMEFAAGTSGNKMVRTWRKKTA
jgi:hypothetical protein